ncbi:MAG: helix-turn-helix domain-containing protein [Micrococcales bacterium]|nr:helix-turn-helix domain-containing protein [Micrococcales bacterium]
MLIPSVMCLDEPLIALDEAIPALSYAVRRPGRARRAPSGDSAQSALIGATRSRVLTAVGEGATTTQLARGLDLPTSTGSSHLAVLHCAGLVSRSREGKSVVYRTLPTR